MTSKRCAVCGNETDHLIESCCKECFAIETPYLVELGFKKFHSRVIYNPEWCRKHGRNDLLLVNEVTL